MIDGPLRFFEELQRLDAVASYYFEALQANDLEKDSGQQVKIQEMIDKINSFDV